MALELPLDQMTTSDKLQAMEQIWDHLCRNAENVPSPPWHRDILLDREERVRRGSAEFTDWDEAKNRIRAAVK